MVKAKCTYEPAVSSIAKLSSNLNVVLIDKQLILWLVSGSNFYNHYRQKNNRQEDANAGTQPRAETSTHG